MGLRGIGLTLAVAMLWLGQVTKAQVAIYGEATGANIGFKDPPHVYGGTFGIYDTKPVGPVALGFDVRVGLTKRGGTSQPLSDAALDMGQLGLRAAFTGWKLPVKPYAEVLVGPAYWRGGLSVARNDASHFLMQVLGGLDVSILPKVQWRVVEFSYGRMGGVPNFVEPETLSTGIVLVLK